MNYNHKGSLAERFIRFRSGILATQDSTTDLFNAFSIYVPSNIAGDNLVDVDLTGIEDQAVVKTATFDNYREIMKGDLLLQWAPIFNQDSNIDVILYIVVFYVPDGLGADVFADYLTVTASEIDYAPLTAAFEQLYFISFFKTIFSPRYDGLAPVDQYDDSNYFDMALAMAQRCLVHLDLSFNLVFNKFALPLATIDTNVCKAVSVDRADELEAATALNVVIGGVGNPRRDYFWGMLSLIQASNTWMVAHSEAVNLFPLIFGTWFGSRNATTTFIGNKLEKIRLSGDLIKPMGTPSLFNSAANTNMPLALAERLDEKNVSYLMSIADGSINDSIILRAKGITGFPVVASQISKWIDYTTSQLVAKYITARNTLGNPVLRNEVTYRRIQEMLLGHLQTFARIGRLENIFLNMPSYSDLPASKTDIIVTQGWEATYVSDLEKVQISGTVVV
jgi:hypothetical protein